MARRLIVITFVVFGAAILWWGQTAFRSRSPAGEQVFHREMSSDQPKKETPVPATNPKLDPARAPNAATSPNLAPSMAVEPLKLGDSLEVIGRPNLKI